MIKVSGLGVLLGGYMMKLKSADAQFGVLAQAGYFVVPKKSQVALRFAYAPPAANATREQLEIRAAFTQYFEGHRWKWANDVGVLTAVDAASGARVWQERVDGVFSASPVAGGGHVYFLGEGGETVVLRAGAKDRAPAIVARNTIGERAVASPAISNGQIFIRTDRHIYAIGR